jgi:transposase
MQPLTFPSVLGAAKIYLYAKNVDMRKSFDGLHAIVQAEFQRDIRQGDLFLFLNRRLDRIKLLHWDRDGMAIWMKRLERGNFQRPRGAPAAAHVEIDATDLALLLAGIELSSVKRRPRYQSPAAFPETQPAAASPR